ncbi:MAG TPA: ABC transporter permease, partial [Ruminococcus sp.]|nr:ABC transporter permease [Ruminococcus sp.]
MQKVLRKRLLRDLRTNFRRYLALTFLIVLCMYIIISMIAAAETVLTGTERKKALNMVQDGSFSVFLPLTDSEIAELEEDGNTIEPEFSTDIPMNDGSTLRMMKNRQKIDIIQLEDGRQAENFGELVIERRYSEEHDLHVNDVISIAGMNFTICGIGTVPDYDFCVAKASDTSAEGSNFGLMFVTPEQYEKIRSDTVQKAEDYTYAYRLGDCTHEELKSIIKDFDFDYTEVNDKYFRETIDEVLQDKEDFQDGIQELYDGTKELSDGMKELDDNSDTLNFVADKLMKVYLDEAHTELLHQGINETVTEENYTQLLENAGLSEMRETLDTIKEFKDGIHDYTDGVNSAYIGSDELHDGVRELKNETDKRLDDLFTFDLDNLTAFTKASDNPRI